MLVATVTEAFDMERVKQFRALVRTCMLSTVVTRKTLHRHNRPATRDE